MPVGDAALMGVCCCLVGRVVRVLAVRWIRRNFFDSELGKLGMRGTQVLLRSSI